MEIDPEMFNPLGKKKKKKKKIPKLPRHNIIIKNADKDTGWMESWDKPKNRSPADIPHSYRALFLGGCGKGKTNLMKQCLLATQSSSRKFKQVYVVQCSMDSHEWDDICPTQVFDRLPEVDMFDTGEKTLLIIDDYEFERMGKEELRKLTTLFRAISTHKSVSIMCSYQSFFHVPSIARKTANFFCIYKPKSNMELNYLSRAVGIKYEDLKHMFREFASDHYDCLIFDDTKNSPYKIRKGLYQKIEYNSDTDEEPEEELEDF